jgi:ectoine hydroxylase-related dioxygenase (phytanoyl-CoA dioxygenase family)
MAYPDFHGTPAPGPPNADARADERREQTKSRRLPPGDVARRLDDEGFAVIESPEIYDRRAELSEAYDAAMAGAGPGEISVRSSTRLHDFVNRGPAFDALYVHEPILAACRQVIGRPFKLSSLLARTLEPGAPAQSLHVDFRSDADGWPMLGFIVMIDDFRADNGATRFVPGSHRSVLEPGDETRDDTAFGADQELALGRAGSILLYNGSVWHGHSANRSAGRRRSIQGAFIRREARPWAEWKERMRPETLGRIGSLAKYLLNLEDGEEPPAITGIRGLFNE